MKMKNANLFVSIDHQFWPNHCKYSIFFFTHLETHSVELADLLDVVFKHVEEGDAGTISFVGYYEVQMFYLGGK